MPAQNSGIYVEGLTQLRRTLRQAGDDLSDFKDTNQRAAQIAASTGKNMAPSRSGKLAATVRSSGTKTAGIIRAGQKTVPYANPIHWGWYSRHILPNPWLSQAAQVSQPQWVGLYEDYLEKSLQKVQGL